MTLTVTVTGLTAPEGTVTIEEETSPGSWENLAGAGDLPAGDLGAGIYGATTTLGPLLLGTRVFRANYTGNSTFDSSGPSASFVQEAVKRPTTTTIVSVVPSPAVFGTGATITAAVTSIESGTPTGSVEFFDGATSLGTATLDGSAEASVAVSILAVGDRSLTAVYAGDGAFAGSSTGGSTALTVTKQPTTTADTVGTPGVTYGTSVTFTATVAGTISGTPTGSVEFREGAPTLATRPLSGGIATWTASSLPAGAHTITAHYLGDGSYAASSGDGAIITVTKAALTVTADNQTRAFGAANPSLTFTYTGFVNGETPANITTPPTCTTTATTSSPVGPYPITCSGGADTDYSFSYVAGQVSVAKKTLTVTASSTSVTYGDPTPPISPGYSGFVLGDKPGDLDTHPTCTTTYVDGSRVAGSPYLSTCSGGSDANYSFSYVPGQVTVTKKTLTVTASSTSVTYGDPAPTVAAGYSGFVNGETATVLDTAPTCTTSYVDGSHVAGSPYQSTCSGGVDADYTFSYVNGQVTVAKKTLTVTASSTSVTYGDPKPPISPGYSGFVNGETAAVVDTPPTCTTTYAQGSGVGAYPSSCSGGVDANYSFSYVAGQVTVTKAALTVTADNQTRAYGAANPSLTFTYTGFVNGDTLGTSGVTGSPTCTTTATQTTSVGTAAITCAAGSVAAENYSFSFVAGNLMIAKAPLTVTASDKSRAYGAANPAFDVTFSGYVNGHTFATSGITGSASCTTAATVTSPVGPYAISCAQGSLAAANYSFTLPFADGTLTISQATSTTQVTRAPATTTYGDSVTFTATVSPAGGGPATGTVAFREGLVTLGTATLDASRVATFSTSSLGGGVHTVTAVYGGDAHLLGSTSAVTAAVSVAKKTVTVTAAAASRAYGAGNPAFATTISGLVNGEALDTSGISGTAACSTVAVITSGIGDYPITCTAGTLSAANYAFAFAPGTLTISPAPLTVTADGKARQYGLPNPTLTATLTGFVNGETASSASLTGAAACTTAALVTDGVGSHAISCARGTLAAPNYAFPAFVDGTFTITQALPAPVLAVDRNPSPASAPVTFTATVTWPTGTPTGTVTFLEGVTDLSGPVALDGTGRASFATSTLPAGSHEITAVYSGDGVNFGGAISIAFTQVVGTSDVNVTLTTNRTTWETNVPITFKAALAPQASGVTVPVTGPVTFRVDGVVKATVSVANGTASYASPALAAGSHTIVASYAPDLPGSANFNAGASTPLTKTVVANTVSASGVGVSGTTIYPVSDTWRDTVAIRGRRLEPISVSITIYSPTGSRVRTKTFARASGTYSYTWNGRTSSGTILAAGKYRVVQVLADAYGARRTYTSYVTLSRKRMYWYTKTLAVSPGPRNYQMRSTTNTSVLWAPSSTAIGALGMVNATVAPAWVAVGYQFSLPAASTYRSLSFGVRGSWTGATAPKVGIIPWNGGSWASVYSLTRSRVAMGTSTTSYYAQTLTSLGGIVSSRSVRASIDSFAAPSGYGPGPFRYSITAVRLVVRYGILR